MHELGGGVRSDRMNIMWIASLVTFTVVLYLISAAANNMYYDFKCVGAAQKVEDFVVY